MGQPYTSILHRGEAPVYGAAWRLCKNTAQFRLCARSYIYKNGFCPFSRFLLSFGRKLYFFAKMLYFYANMHFIS